MDGEVADAELDILLAELDKEESREEWKIYHQIGDVLRANDSNGELSAGFSARLKARLELEPVHGDTNTSDLTANQLTTATGTEKQLQQQSGAHRWVVPGVLAIAATTVGVFAGPQLTMATKGQPAADGTAKVASSASLTLPATDNQTGALGAIKANGQTLVAASTDSSPGAQVIASTHQIGK
ncbi:sigma-E factor negative regulatory protein RseA [Noviherbaspirillum humi]|uniref:Sigma-E factor negative regulatory protein RseA n=2 Tax=Noviherbaspirillum humi TaxID=1688639 RepID=A0A239H483_9BURK|nr:sigma-E factor negative regulatory protein RseA [Noviherbaspirillum humi]